MFRYVRKAAGSFISFLLSVIRRNRGLYLTARGIRSIKRNGIAATAGKTADHIQKYWKKRFASLKNEIFITKHDRSSQENTVFPRRITISVITPLYNTKPQHLQEMIESVTAQTYSDWELCLADGSDNGHQDVRELCESYAINDTRIKYRKLETNLGVSGNSNSALEMSTGAYIGLLDHDDILHPSAFFEIMEAICRDEPDFVYTDEAFFTKNRRIALKHHKPDYAVDTLRSHNYISRFTVFSRALMEKAGVFRSEFDGSQDYDLILRYTDTASRICHIPKLLYFHRLREKSNVDKKMLVISASEHALREHLGRHNISARVEGKIGLPGFYRLIYDLKENPRVSIIIPNKDHASILRTCVSSIKEKTTYNSYEIIIVENNSREEATFTCYKELERHPDIRIVRWEGKGFNYSEICNYGMKHARGSQLVFLNNDVEIITPNWIEEMLMFSQRDDVGIVGMKLYFPNGSVQHAGVILGVGGVAGHAYYGAPHNAAGYMGKLQIAQNMSVVTAACMMIKRTVFEKAGCFTPEFYASFNDVDLCLKIRQAGYLVVWTPYAEAYHYESKSRGYNTTTDKQREFAREVAMFKGKWGKELAAGDPYYNPGFTLENADYVLA